jgi:D-tyrosyl-tRNA(Tyr) deacylase
MRCLVERVLSATLKTPEKKAHIDRGLLVYVGFKPGDTQEDVRTMAQKLLGLRIFEDATGKMNLDLDAVNGRLLLVPAFTLYADANTSRRPNLSGALAYTDARALFDMMVETLTDQVSLETGVFGADMQVNAINDGPITLILEASS